MIILNSITAAVSCFNYLRCEISYKKSCKHCSTRASGDVRDQQVTKAGKFRCQVPKVACGNKIGFKKKLAD